MDYYKAKQEAFSLIDSLFSKGIDDVTIHFKVQTQFGFGKKIVNDRLDLLKKMEQR